MSAAQDHTFYFYIIYYRRYQFTSANTDIQNRWRRLFLSCDRINSPADLPTCLKDKGMRFPNQRIGYQFDDAVIGWIAVSITYYNQQQLAQLCSTSCRYEIHPFDVSSNYDARIYVTSKRNEAKTRVTRQESSDLAASLAWTRNYGILGENYRKAVRAGDSERIKILEAELNKASAPDPEQAKRREDYRQIRTYLNKLFYDDTAWFPPQDYVQPLLRLLTEYYDVWQYKADFAEIYYKATCVFKTLEPNPNILVMVFKTFLQQQDYLDKRFIKDTDKIKQIEKWKHNLIDTFCLYFGDEKYYEMFTPLFK